MLKNKNKISKLEEKKTRRLLKENKSLERSSWICKKKKLLKKRKRKNKLRKVEE